MKGVGMLVRNFEFVRTSAWEANLGVAQAFFDP